GQAKTPAMGWRSWNCYHADIDQGKMESVMAAMVNRSRLVVGQPTSLHDLGYQDVGLDDNWQACGAGHQGSFFSEDGTPLINTDRFPNMTAMVEHGHALGLKVGWYMNNCICSVTNITDTDFVDRIYKGFVNALTRYGYD
ncbi:uncharacterized protein MONBRDRAFT_3278, partial [Monosiga brevicollis MX1]